MPLTVIALEASGVTDTGFADTVDFSLTFGTGVLLPSPGTLTAGVGVFTLTASTVAPNTFSLNAYDSLNISISGARNGISVLTGPFSQFVLTPSTYNPTAGNFFTVTAQAADAYGNNVMGSYSLTFTSSDPGVTFSPPAGVTNSSGQGTFSATLNTTGTQGITVTGGGHSGFATFNVN
jgi:hypothetical protein